jgi:hypothetical protein
MSKSKSYRRNSQSSDDDEQEMSGLLSRAVTLGQLREIKRRRFRKMGNRIEDPKNIQRKLKVEEEATVKIQALIRSGLCRIKVATKGSKLPSQALSAEKTEYISNEAGNRRLGKLDGNKVKILKVSPFSTPSLKIDRKTIEKKIKVKNLSGIFESSHNAPLSSKTKSSTKETKFNNKESRCSSPRNIGTMLKSNGEYLAPQKDINPSRAVNRLSCNTKNEAGPLSASSFSRITATRAKIQYKEKLQSTKNGRKSEFQERLRLFRLRRSDYKEKEAKEVNFNSVMSLYMIESQRTDLFPSNNEGLNGSDEVSLGRATSPSDSYKEKFRVLRDPNISTSEKMRMYLSCCKDKSAESDNIFSSNDEDLLELDLDVEDTVFPIFYEEKATERLFWYYPEDSIAKKLSGIETIAGEENSKVRVSIIEDESSQYSYDNCLFEDEFTSGLEGEMTAVENFILNKRKRKLQVVGVAGFIFLCLVIITVVSLNLWTSDEPFVEAKTCFESKYELRMAVDNYINDNSPFSDVAKKYGWPINEWCVRNIEDFSNLFRAEIEGAGPLRVSMFDKDISDWDVSNAKSMRKVSFVLWLITLMSFFELSLLLSFPDVLWGSSFSIQYFKMERITVH